MPECVTNIDEYAEGDAARGGARLRLSSGNIACTQVPRRWLLWRAEGQGWSFEEAATTVIGE